MASRTSGQQPARQRSAAERFESRVMDIVSRAEMTGNAIFFYKKVSKSMATPLVQGPYAYALEFPVHFLKQHNKKFGIDVTFQTMDSERTWPIKVTVRSFKHSHSRVFAYGDGGWKAFLTDNHIKVGDILIFVMRSFSKFEVVIGRVPAE